MPPLVYNVREEKFLDYTWRKVRSDIRARVQFKQGPPLENAQSQMFSARAGLFGMDTPGRALQLVTELFSWWRVAKKERLALKQLLTYVNNKGSDSVFRNKEQKQDSRKIVLLIDDLGAGGSQRQLVLLAHGLHAAGHHVTVATLVAQRGQYAYFVDSIADEGIELIEVMTQKADMQRDVRNDNEVFGIMSGMPYHIRNQILPLYAFLNDSKPELFISFLDNSNVLGATAALLADIGKIVCFFRGHQPAIVGCDKPWFRRYYRTIVKTEKPVLAGNAHSVAESYARWLGLDSRKIAIVRNGIDCTEIETLSAQGRDVIGTDYRPKDVFVIVGVFRLSSEKQPDLFLNTIVLVKQHISNLKVFIVGDGPERVRLEQQIQHLGLADTVTITGVVRNPYPYMSLSDVVLLTSRLEGAPNVLLEAQCLGKPVVTLAAGGAKEAVVDGETGYVVGQPKADLLCKEIIRVLEDRELARKMGSAGKRFVRETFSSDKMRESILYL